MAGFTCPYCGMVMSVNDHTRSVQLPSFESACGINSPTMAKNYNDSTIGIVYNTDSAEITVDLTGTNMDESETGIDYNVARDYRKTLQMVFTQDAFEAGNDLYFADIEIVDLGEVVTTGGASVLTSAAADAGSSLRQRHRHRCIRNALSCRFPCQGRRSARLRHLRPVHRRHGGLIRWLTLPSAWRM